LEIHNDACLAYMPSSIRSFSGAAHLLWPAEDELPNAKDSSASWKKVFPAIQVHQVPGGHFSVLTGESLRAVTEVIRECLDKAEKNFDAKNALGSTAQPPLKLAHSPG